MTSGSKKLGGTMSPTAAVSERQSERLGGLSETGPGGVLQWQGPTDQDLALPGWDEGLAVTAFAESWRWRREPFGE